MAAEAKKENFKGGLTRRWLIQTTTIIAAVLLIICIIASYLIHSYYYATAERKIESYANGIVDVYFENYASTDEAVFEKGAREYIGDFTDKSSVEVWILDRYGNVLISSSGFPVNEKAKIPEYEAAIESQTKSAVWHGANASDENIIALTKIITNSENQQVGSVRYMISLEEVDNQITTWYLIILLAFLLLVVLLVISGMVFISSIVKPIQEVCDTAKMIANGNYDARIDHYLYKDEVGQLCSTINDMAEKIKTSDKIKNDFISTVSHELRTPLTAIKGWSETLQAGYDEDTYRKGMTVITHETGRLEGMVEELLDFSRIQNGRFTLQMANRDIIAELDDALLIYTDKARKENKTIHYTEPEFLCVVYGDKNRLRQVFINVIDNAIKYSDPGDTVKIDAFRQGDNIVITVADTGCGISPEDLPKIKTKFFKANQTRRGSGIGLAVASEIIQMHNGTIDIESTLNVGTTVLIHLPIQRQEGNTERNIENEQQG